MSVPERLGSDFRFRVTGVADNGPSRRSYDLPVDEVFLVAADDVGDALTDLVRRSGIWEQIDAERGFTIEYLVGEDFPMPSAEERREALERRLASLTDYGARHGNVPNLQDEIDAVRAELVRLEAVEPDELPDPDGSNVLPIPEGPWSR